MGVMRITADAGSCCGAGQCTAIAPAVFGQSDEDGSVIILDAQPPPELRDVIRTAVLRCPSRAIGVGEG